MRSNQLSYGPSDVRDLSVSKRLVADFIVLLEVALSLDVSPFCGSSTPRGRDHYPGDSPERVSRAFSGKEVIQPQVPLRLPCYDFTPIIEQTVDASLPCGLGQRLQVHPTFVV